MYYTFKKQQAKGWTSGKVHSRDGVIVWTSPAWDHYVGRRLTALTNQLRDDGYYIWASDSPDKLGSRV